MRRGHRLPLTPHPVAPGGRPVKLCGVPAGLRGPVVAKGLGNALRVQLGPLLPAEGLVVIAGLPVLREAIATSRAWVGRSAASLWFLQVNDWFRVPFPGCFDGRTGTLERQNRHRFIELKPPVPGTLLHHHHRQPPHRDLPRAARLAGTRDQPLRLQLLQVGQHRLAVLLRALAEVGDRRPGQPVPHPGRVGQRQQHELGRAGRCPLGHRPGHGGPTHGMASCKGWREGSEAYMGAILAHWRW